MTKIKEFIISTSIKYFSKKSTNLTVNENNDSLKEFIEDSLRLTLCSFIRDDTVEFQLEITGENNPLLIFFKSKSIALGDDDDISHLRLMVIKDNPIESFYLTLRLIYGPLLQLDNSTSFNPKLQEIITNLEANLRTLASGSDGGPSLMVILTIDDELEYWQTIAKESKTKKQKEMADAFTAILATLSQEMGAVDISDPIEIKDAMESAGGLLDDLWRHSMFIYPQKRMIHMLDVLGNTCVSKLRDILEELDIWTSDSNILAKIIECSEAVSIWLTTCLSLTQKFWPNHSLHVWEGTPYVPQYAKKFNDRLQEVLEIKSIHSQLVKLLSYQEQEELKMSQFFNAFTGINIWKCTPQNNATWLKAKSRFEKTLKPAEDRISEKLRLKFNNTSTMQTLYEFNKYAALIERPTVFVALQKERQIFMATITQLLKSIENEIGVDKTASDNEFVVPEVSPLVQQIQWTKRMEGKVSQIEHIIKNLLSDLEGQDGMKTHASSVKKSIHNLQTLLYEDWTRNLQMDLNNKTIILSPDMPVVQFSKDDNLMRVTFNPKLISLERDIRHMGALGFVIPLNIKEAVNYAAKFMEHARALQQIASFHNTQSERMIPSQSPMMLNAAMNLASLVREQTAVAWKDVESVSDYVNKLKTAVENLVKQNSYLTNQHILLRNIVLSLMDMNLLQKQSEWKKHIRHMREIIEKVETNGYTNTKPWINHWNIQLYKALEHQYRTVLIDPLSHLSIIKAELIFRQQSVHLQPPIEDIRALCHNQLKKLIALPLHFVGLHTQYAENESIFTSIISRNSWLIAGAMQEVEKTLQKAIDAVQRWKIWGALGSVDLENLCEIHLSHTSDWERNFKECKALGQKLAKLPMEEEEIDWILISSASLRNDLESHNRRYWLSLTSSLQSSLHSDSVLLDGYIMSVQSAVEQVVPKNAKDLAVLNEHFFKLKEREPQMKASFEELRRKQTMVRAWGGERMHSLDGLSKRWENVMILMQNHEKLIAHQAESAKAGLANEWANICASVDVWYTRWTQNRPKIDQLANVNLTELQNKYKLFIDASESWQKFSTDKTNIFEECPKFNLSLDEHSTWDKIEKCMNEDTKFWEPFKNFTEELNELASQEWIIIQKKLHLLDDLIIIWRERLEPYTAVTLFIQKEIDKYKEIMSSLKYLKSSDFTEKHWREVYSLLGIPTKPPDTLILKDLLDVSQNIKSCTSELQKIWLDASHEAVVREAIAELELWLAGARLVMMKHINNKGEQITIIKDFKEIITKVEEYQNLAGSARAANNVKDSTNSNDQLSLWENRLSHIKTILSSLAHIQRKWVYLEPILSGDNLSKGDKINSGTFSRLDKDFKHIMRSLESDSRLTVLTRYPGIDSLLETLTNQLIQCQNTLEEYIEEKRTVFPRFFFLSDDDLLELLGQAQFTSQNKESVMQTHIKKLFPGATGVHLGPNAVCITALQGQFDEKLMLDTPVDIDAPIEVWLKHLEGQMRASLHTSIKQCLLQSELHTDLLNHPTQVLCLVQSIKYTDKIEKSISKHTLHEVKESVDKDLNLYLKSDNYEKKSGLDKHKLQSLVLQCYHYLGIIKELIENGVASIDNWQWKKQLRFYIENNAINARMGLAKLPYTYEYLGINTGSLVRTQLTDQCFLILTQALHLGLAGNPFGPAGTGKTESVKALGGLLGRLVLVFNCDEGMDKLTMGRLLTGLAMSGAWGCFDEFNRLEEKTLFDITKEFGGILEAIGSTNNTKVAVLNDNEITVSSGCGIFVTMNPAGGSYGGRRNLPEGINRLLRPCAMWQPHAVSIASALLATHGYSNSQKLAEKLVMCFDMAKSLLSDTIHYDWGLRALKTIIGSCGSLFNDHIQESKKYPDAKEQIVLIVQALRLNILSKLTFEDTERFESIIKIVFPDVNYDGNTYNQLREAIEESCRVNNFIINENQVSKCIELYNQLRQRMGVVIVGPPGSGKTALQTILKHALSIMGKSISTHVICPKAMTRTDLLGYIDNDTRKWYDGVISTISLQVANQSPDIWSWVICDGDVDPEWIESLNSVLDDNRLLTLPSGWRIQFGNNVNFIFETDDLSYASPATISRMGIILLSEEQCSFEEVIKSWMMNSSNMNNLEYSVIRYIEDLLNKVLNWAAVNHDDFLVSYFKVPLTKQILSFLDIDDKGKIIEDTLAIALMKALSCIIKPKAYNALLEQISNWTNVSSHALLWSNSTTTEQIYSSMSIGNGLFFISKRVTELLEIIRPWIDSNQHFMIFGPPASGKSMILDHLLNDMGNSIIITLQCTPVFDVEHIIQALRQKSALKSSSESSNKKVVLVIKSLQRAKMDKWKSSLVQSFLLQLIHHRGFWQKSNVGSEGMYWCSLQKFVLIITATMEENDLKISNRLSNSLRIVNIMQPDKVELSEICHSYLNKTIENMEISNDDKRKMSEFNSKIFSTYYDVVETIQNEIQYKWTPNDLTKWCRNLSLYKIRDLNVACQAIQEEAKCIFRDRLAYEDKKTLDVLFQKNLNIRTSKENNFIPRITKEEFCLDVVENKQLMLSINKMINQCNNEMENGNYIFGENNIEQCEEIRRLSMLASRTIGGGVNGVVFVGTAGIGRRAAARIAAEFMSAKFVSISTSNQFTLQIKNILMACGCEGTPTLIVLEEAVSCDESILGVIEGLISKGSGRSSISLPFHPQEIDTFISQLKGNKSPSKNIAVFIENLQKYLGIVLLLDAKQSNLKSVLSSFPFLYQRCQFIWLNDWLEISMKEVPLEIVKKLQVENKDLEKCLGIVSTGKLYDIHSSIIKDNLRTPYRYISFLKTFLNIYTDRKRVLEEKRKKLESGVMSLNKAKEEVDRLKEDAAQQQLILAEKQTLANQALNQIGATMQSATGHRQEMEVLKKNTEIENGRLQERKKAIEQELSEVEPIIQEARTAVGDIRAESLSEVRSLRAPPEPVRDVLEGVLRLMGIADTSWHSMKTFLSKRGIKDDIRTFDAANISKDNLLAVEKLLASHESSFSEKTAKRASVACAPLAAWVLANVKYANVLHKIAPLENEQRKLVKNLREAETQIVNLSTDLNSVDERVAALKEQLNVYTKQATEVEINLNGVQNTISKAENLVNKLSKEFARWHENLQKLSKEYEEISICAVFAAGFITYLTNEKEDQRISIIQKWMEYFPEFVSSFSIKDFLLSHDNEIKWIDYGLPSDSTAVNNAILINEVLKDPKCGLVPLIIDPNNTALTWLLKVLESTPKDIVIQSDPKFSTILQHALRFGRIFIVKELLNIDDNWSSLLRGQIPAITMGLNNIHPLFRLILLSRDSSLPNRLSSFHKSIISIINFTPQHQGLTDQLIFSAVKQEEPELQFKMLEVKSKKNALQIQQEELETQLLNQLSSGDILHNSNLLESLEYTQKASVEITKSLNEAAELSESINKQCEFYKPLAAHTATASLSISTLTYEYPLISLSLQTVTSIFLKWIPKLRGTNIMQDQIVRNIIVGLLERVLVALNKECHSSVLIYLIHLIYPDQIKQQEWDLFTSNVDNYTKDKSDILKDFPRWIQANRTIYIYTLQTYLPELYALMNLENEAIWKKFINSGDWESIPVDNITPFQKILITWALKPNKIQLSIMKAVAQILGTSQLYPNGDLITTVERWGSPHQPILVIGASGTDPIDQIKTRAVNIVGINNYRQIWLSESNAVETKDNFTEAISWVMKSGGWLVILTSASDWSDNDSYRNLIQTHLHYETPEPNARIWIVSENSNMPYLLTSHCINVIMEPPTGIKNNLLRILSIWGPNQDAKGIEKHVNDPKQTRLEFSLALAHSIIQERCSYIPQGWRYNYQFSWGDVEVSGMAVRTVGRTEAGGLCKALYGGRIYWEQDVKLMHTLLDRHFDESVIGHMWKPLGMDVSLPMTNKLQDYLPMLTKFPSYDDPALLSLPQNIQLAQEQQKGESIILNLKSLAHGLALQDFNKKVLKKRLSPILTLWKKLNSGTDAMIKSKITDFKNENSWSGMKALMFSELELAIFGIHNIHQDLSSLHSSSSIDSDKNNLATDLISDKTPQSWLKYWNGGNISASVFLTGFCERATLAKKRVLNSNGADLASLSLSSFLKPNCVLHAIYWEAAKRLSLPPEELKLVSKWGDNESNLSIGKIVLLDLWLEGAVWESGRLQPCRHDTPYQTKAPPISIQFVANVSLAEYVDKSQFEIPIFTSSERKDMVFQIGAPSADQFNKKIWLLNSAALIIA